MFNKYAIEPELVVAWCGNPFLHTMYKDAFGVAAGRLVGLVPKTWARRVHESCPADPALRKSRVTEFLAGLKEAFFGGGAPYDENKPWVDNAVAAHSAVDFKAILASAPNPAHGIVLDAFNAPVPAQSWDVPATIPVAQQGSAVSAAIQPLLSRATELILVDPYFQPGRASFRDFLSAVLRSATDGRAATGLQRVEYLCSPKIEWIGTFDADCLSLLPQVIPSGVTLAVIKIDQKTNGERIHDRFVLTNKCGWLVPGGLDNGPPGETTDLVTLSAASYIRRWADYAVSPPFWVSKPVLVAGTA